jgi:uncharacterized protein
MLFRVVFTLGFWLLIDLYFFQGFKAAISAMAPAMRRNLTIGYWVLDLALMSVFVYLAATGRVRPGGSSGITLYVGLMFLTMLPKLIGSSILLFEDVFRLFESGYSWARSLAAPENQAYYPARRKFIGQLAVGLAAIPFAGILYGITRGKYDFRVVRQDVFFKDLPMAFEGFTITQISDVHSGSFDDTAAVARGVELANAQKSDLLVFTGDLVNSRAAEMDPYKGIFGSLNAAFGKFSILGNHDYGHYAHWESEQAEAQNFQQMVDTHAEIGFKLLRNEAVRIEKDGQWIDLMGVENWSKTFGKFGDLNKTVAQTTPGSFKILLSHDPTHWEAETVPHPEKIHLTLAGHTHGSQFGVDIPGLKWSPVQYVYKQWSGLYNRDDQNIYVNRGFGFLGFPGRVGMWPEITVLTLRSA